MEKTKPQITWAVTVVAAFATGLLLAFWITRLDPDGTGGSVLAAPAILTAAGISLVSFIFGLVTLFDPVGRRLCAFGIFLLVFMFLGAAILR